MTQQKQISEVFLQAAQASLKCWFTFSKSLDMGRINQCALKQDKKSAEEVKKYPCLYDKTGETYKHKVRKDDAWTKIDETLERQPERAIHD